MNMGSYNSFNNMNQNVQHRNMYNSQKNAQFQQTPPLQNNQMNQRQPIRSNENLSNNNNFYPPNKNMIDMNSVNSTANSIASTEIKEKKARNNNK